MAKESQTSGMGNSLGMTKEGTAIEEEVARQMRRSEIKGEEQRLHR